MKYLSCADTAKLLRTSLKEAFPGVKFTVRSSVYAGGASIDVGWTAGPYPAQVKEITSLFEGANFDGMTDLKTHLYHTLDGEPASMGADYVFENVEYPDDLLEVAILDIRGIFPDAPPYGVKEYRQGIPWCEDSGLDLSVVIQHWLNGKSQFSALSPYAGIEPRHSPTASRLSRA